VYNLNLFVRNITRSVTEQELKNLFEKHGAVNSTKIITDHDTKVSKGYGFIEMPDVAEAQAAIENLNDYEFQGRPLGVNEARPREPRSY